VRRHVKASFAGSNAGNGNGRALLGRAFAVRAFSHDATGSGAPSGRQVRGRLGLLALAITSLLAIVAAPAVAAPKGAINDFGSLGTGNGQFGANAPVGIAINQSGSGGAGAGDLYVVDSANNRIQRFNADGDFLGSFGSTGTGGGQFQNPRGIAVDQFSGSVYVTDQTNRRVLKFSASGSFLRMWGWGVLNGAAAFQICTSSQTCQAALTTSGAEAGRFGSSIGFPAVEPTTGDVYVGDVANRRINVYDSAGNFLRAMGWDVNPGGAAVFETCTATCQGGNTSSGTEDGRFGSSQPTYLAIDSSGATHVLFASDSNLNNRVQRIDITAPAAPVAMSAIGSPPLLNAVTSGLAVDPATSNLLVARDPSSGETVIQEVTTPSGVPALGPDSHAGGEGWSTSASGPVGAIAIKGSSGRLYVTRPGVSQVAVLNSGGLTPTATLNATSAITATTATLNATVNPNGSKTYYQFQYRAVGGGAFINVPTALTSAGIGAADVKVSAALAGLLPGTPYEVQLLADGYGAPLPLIGTDATGDFATTALAPTVVNRSAAPVTDTGAQLQAQINPNNLATNYYFQYLSDAAFKANGNSYTGPNVPVQAPLVPATLPAGTSPVVVFQQVTGLAPQTTYHFRVVANNGTGGDQLGADQTFVTEVPPTPGSPGAARAYELVSPPDKLGGAGVGNWYAGFGSHASAGVAAVDANRYVSYSYYGSTLADGGFAYGSDATLGERTPTGWVNKAAFNHQGGYGTSEFAKLPGLSGGSEDFSLITWGAGSQLSLFQGQADLFGESIGSIGGQAVREWGSGRWEIVAPFALGQQAGSVFEMTSQVAADGGYVLISGPFRGVAGSGDPTNVAFTTDPSDPCATACDANVYIDDVTAGLSNTFPGDGVRSLVNVCTGAGASRTAIPSVDGAGKLVAAQCPAALPGRDARVISPRGASLGYRGGAPTHISADGSRVFFMSPSHRIAPAPCSGTGVLGTACPAQLYVRQRNADGSIAVRWISRSAVADQDAGLLAAAVFEGATPDGDKVFFRTSSPLTADDPNGGAQVPGGVRVGSANPNSTDLYMYDFPNAPTADPGDGTLTRISGGPTGAADANVFTEPVDNSTSSLRAVSDDGSSVYFVASTPLPGVAAPANGTITGPGAGSNLYLYNTDQPLAQRWRFVARLAGGPLGACAASGGQATGGPLAQSLNGIGGGSQFASGNNNCVRVNADGSFLTFFTDARLTADDPNSVSGDIYAYDAGSNELIRVSAPQGGPGGSYTCVTSAGTQCYGDPGVSSGTTAGIMLQQPTHPAEPADHSVFFESASRLVPEDENSVYDVYQWHNGKLSLLSPGEAGTEPALYRGNDRSGRNVYISTRQRLTWQDVDSVLDVYVARTNGGFPEPVQPPACDVLADGCQGAPAGAPAVTPASSTVLAGSGNVIEKPKGAKKKRKCASGKTRQGKKCVAKKQKRNANKTGRAAK
jgi:hypothetical protein